MTTFTATYSPDDNKLRLYASSRLDAPTFARVKGAGFKWAPKQGLFVAPAWSPAREDLLLELAGEVGDEDTTLTERAEERAERFEGFEANRRRDHDVAHRAVSAIADNIPLGQPILVGHHSEKRARKDAERIQNGMRRAVKMWDTAQYWKQRAAGALRHAKYKERPDVRARRIKTLEAERRKVDRNHKRASTFLRYWQAAGLTQEQALGIANHDHISACFPVDKYPRRDGQSTYEGQMSIWSALSDGIITADQARAISVPVHERCISHAERWLAHLDNRLTYERAMLEDAGGTVADRTVPEVGGAVRCLWAPRGGWAYIVKVNRVTVTLRHQWSSGGRVFAHNEPFDKLNAIMSRADVEQARADGRLKETDNGVGFWLMQSREEFDKANPPELNHTASRAQLERFAAISGRTVEAEREYIDGLDEIAQERYVTAIENAEKAKREEVAGMRETLRQGVKVAQVPQLFPTPGDIAARMVELAEIPAGARVLEPSAGTGAIVRAIHAAHPGQEVFCVELNVGLHSGLMALGDVALRGGDFIEIAPTLGKFDRILMNPPFADAVDVKHIKAAAALLKPGGRLVALCANGPRQGRELEPLAYSWEPLPSGSFKSQGTDVAVTILEIRAPEALELEQPTPQQLRERSLAEERARAEVRDHEVPPPSELRLTGSDRDADQAIAHGQRGLFD